MAVKHLSNGNDDGTLLSQSATDKIAAFGATPVVQQSATKTTQDTTVSISTTTTKWGFASSTQANDLTKAVSEILAALKNLGFIA